MGKSENDYIPGTSIIKPKCELIGQDGNAFSIMGRVKRTLLRADVPIEVIDAYVAEATSGNYDHLLATTMKYVEIVGPDDNDDDDEDEDDEWDNDEDDDDEDDLDIDDDFENEDDEED